MKPCTIPASHGAIKSYRIPVPAKAISRPRPFARSPTPRLTLHDGSLPTLAEVIEFYDAGGCPNPNLDTEMRPLLLTSAEKKALANFLRALTALAKL